MAPEARLTSGLRVAALLARAAQEGVGAYVVARGDDTAGSLRVLATGREAVLFREARDADFRRVWERDPPVPEAEAAAALARERARDRDLWVIELDAAPDRITLWLAAI